MKKTSLYFWMAILLPNVALTQAPCKNSEIILQLKPGEIPELVVRQIQAKWPTAHFTLKKTLSKRFHAYLLDYECDNDSAFDLGLLRNETAIVSASWNEPVEFRRDSVPNDTLFPTQWNLKNIRLPEVWSLAQGGHTPSGKEIVVAVIDNGFDLLHPDLQANFWRNPNEDFDGQDNDGNHFPDDVFGWNFHDNSPVFPLTSSHGTGVAGVIGAQGNNVTGVSGVNWQVKILPVHFQETAEIIPAFEYVLDMRERYNASGGQAGAFVVATNGSFGLKEPVDCATLPIWGTLYDTLGAAGIMNVAATRNDNFDIDVTGDMPSSCSSEFLITVTASDSTDQRLSGVAFGKKAIDLAAPGASIPTTDLNGRFRFGFEGTSAACPHVAGAIALLYSLPCAELDSLAHENPAATALLVRDAILKGVHKLPGLKNRTTTGGRLDVYNSMKYLHSYCIAKPTERGNGSFDENYIGGRNILKIYPNPVSDKLTVEYSITDFQILKFRVYNILGQEMQLEIAQQAEPFEPQVLKLDVSSWAAGTYFVNMFDLGKGISVKFVKL